MAGQPTTGFARGGWQGDAISDMIEDSEKALKGLPAKPPPDGPDPKSLKDAFLETSPHFQAMLQALEVFDSSVSSGGPAPAKYEQALFSALRTMLRECLFTKNAGLRKHHIDRVHTWFVDKRMATDQSAHMAAAPTGPTEKPLVNTWNASMAIRPSTAGQLDGRRTTAVESAAARPYTGELARAMSAEPPISHGADEDGASGGAKLPPKERIKEYRMRNLRVSQMRRAGIPIQSIRAAEDAAKQMHQANRHAAEAELDGAVADEATDRAIRELWLSKREAEEMERRSEQEVQDAIAVWAHQRARVEEEVSRRQESIRYASQTALLHARPATAVHHMMQGAIAEEGSMMLGMSSTRSPGHRPGTARSGRASVGVRSPGLRNDVSIQSDDSDDDTVEIVEDMIKAAALPDKFHKIPLLKAPYDGLRHANTPAGWPISSLARPISARLAGHDPDSFFGRASNGSSPRLFNRTAPARPQTAGARFALGTTIAAYDETRGPPMTPAQQQTFNATNLKLHGFSSPHISRSRPSSGYHSAQTTVPQSPEMDPSVSVRLGTSSARPMSAARAARNNELTEVDRIKRAFARARIPCALNIIERALVVPEDRSYARCVETLPRAGVHLLPDFILAEKKSAKGKGAKGAKGKKGKKKK